MCSVVRHCQSRLAHGHGEVKDGQSGISLWAVKLGMDRVRLPHGQGEVNSLPK